MIRKIPITILCGLIILLSGCVKEEVSTKNEDDNNSPTAAIEVQVVKIVNDERAKHKLAPLQIDESLMKSCDIRTKEIVTKFSHDRPNGASCFSVIEIQYSAAGENIAKGQNNAEVVMNSWMNSEGHRKNILSENYTHIGVGCFENDNILHWVQLFIRRK